jgi:hypothetical protein
MPFTPFHLGPGLFAKSMGPRHVSLTAFAATQVVVDIEPLYYIIRGEYPVHRWIHTVWLAGTIGLATGAAISVVARRWLATAHALARTDLAMGAALLGGLLGGVSHPLLDGLMHRDVRALRPFSEATWVLHPSQVPALYMACALLGVWGGLRLVARRANL